MTVIGFPAGAQGIRDEIGDSTSLSQANKKNRWNHEALKLYNDFGSVYNCFFRAFYTRCLWRGVQDRVCMSFNPDRFPDI